MSFVVELSRRELRLLIDALELESDRRVDEWEFDRSLAYHEARFHEPRELQDRLRKVREERPAAYDCGELHVRAEAFLRRAHADAVVQELARREAA